MAVVLLTNTAGENISGIALSGGSTTTGYSLQDLIAGPRSTMWRRNSTATTGRVIYTLTSNIAMTHCVVARADLLLTKAGQNVAVEYNDGSNQAIQNYSPLTAADLVGISVGRKGHGQDLVCAFPAPVEEDQFQLAFDAAASASEANLFSKLYFCRAFDFGTEPSKEPRWQGYHADKAESVKPIMGYEDYALRDAIAMRWEFVSRQQAAAFEALNLRWPLFLYDEAGDVFEHRLEHVIVTQWSWERVGEDYFHVDVTFRRLAHYE